jgi:hypothetical protein
VAVATTAALLVFATALTLLLVTPDEGFWINDCGNKALVAKRLLETGFRDPHFDHPAVAVDRSAAAFPIVPPFVVARPAGFLSVYPLAYPVLSAPFLAAFGPIGLRLPAALGLAACAGLMVSWLAPVFGKRWALAGGLSLALATPLFFYGVTLWEHSLTVALSLGVWTLLDRDSSTRLFAAGWLLATACWLREELALMGVAVALAAWLHWRRPGSLLWLAAGAVLPISLLLGVNEWLYGNPFGAHLAASRGAGGDASGLAQSAGGDSLQALPSLLAGIGRSAGERALLGFAGFAAPILGWFAARRARGALATAAVWAAVTGVGLAVWGLGAIRMLGADQPLEALVRHNGLMIQMPMFALVGIGAAAFCDRAFASLRIGVLSGALFLLFVLVAGGLFGSGYGVQSGFGVHWGPRVLLPALPALLALAMAAARAGLASPSVGVIRASGVVTMALLIAGLASSALATVYLVEQKRDAARFQESLRARPEQYILSTHPLLAQHLPGLWDDKPQLLATDAASLTSAIAGLRSGGAAGFLLVVPAGASAASLPGVACAVVDRYRGEWLHYFDLDTQRCRFATSGRQRRR